MIIYNTALLENTFLVSKANRLKKAGFIQENDLDNIQKSLETLKTSRNFLVRIGFFILGTLMFLSTIGFFSIFILNSNFNEKYIGFIYAAIGFFALELISKEKYFRHGLDDAISFGTQISLYISVYLISDSLIFVAISMIIMGFILCVRYINIVSLYVFLSGIVLLVGYLFIEYSTMAVVLPFVLFGIAVAFYFIFTKIKNDCRFYLYADGLEWFFIFSLILGYASINYFVVRTLSEELLQADYSKSALPFGWIFNALMFLFPVVYVFYALKTKDRVLLYIGALAFVLSVATFRQYHNLMPAEWAFVLSSVLLFSAVYFSIQKTKDKTTGITFKADYSSNSALFENVQALIVNSQQMNNAPVDTDSPMPFGAEVLVAVVPRGIFNSKSNFSKKEKENLCI